LQIVYLSVGGLVVSVALALAASSPACGGGKPIVSISYGVKNDVDTGSRGNEWAHLTYARSVRVWRRGSGAFCAVSGYNGTFESIAGPSPGGRWQLPDGVGGTMQATSLTMFRGRFSPGRAPTRGFLGVKGPWEWSNDYFSGVTGFRYASYTFRYVATQGGTGTWTDMLRGGRVHDNGDIKAARPEPRR
jgi:hypothetical protein